jgi:hypothetical protein
MTAASSLPLRRMAPLVAILIVATTLTAWAQKPLRIKTKGKVSGVVAGAILMAEDGGKSYTIKVPAGQNVVHVTGTLSAEKLQPGMIMRFTGKLKGSTVEGDITELKIFTPNDGYDLGLIQDDPAQDATVTGQLTKINKGILTISAGRKRLTGKLAENANIVIDSKDYSIAKAGDGIQAEGTVGKDGTVSARKVIITVGGPPAAEVKKPGKKQKT